MMIISVLVAVLGVSIFFWGFFLTRREIKAWSVCDASTLVSGLPSTYGANTDKLEKQMLDSIIASSLEIDDGSSCWSAKKYDRVFVFIVDALRLDFMTAVSGESGERTMMPLMHDLLRKNESQSRFFGFRADPPTVTAQRLKGLTTGSLPTFIDIGSNFDSAIITEDNFVDQLSQNQNKNKKNIFMGDDTWVSLYPSQFNESTPFPSFDTRDLDTVDDGVERILFPSLEAAGEDWGLFVAHFLGVDHIGHTYHAHHPLMESRVARMDRLLDRVVHALPPRSLLVLFGDHGMTDDGNHGGATVEETDSGIFFYSSSPLSEEETGGSWDPHSAQFRTRDATEAIANPRMISQVDLVPTLSLLLGVPIPYSNIGGIIPELFLSTKESLVNSLFLNSIQIMRYLRHYDESSTETKKLQKSLANIIVLHHDLLNKEVPEINEEKIQRMYLNFLDSAISLGRKLFTQFNIFAMLIGILVVLYCLWILSKSMRKIIANLENSSSIYVVLAISLSMLHALSGFSDNGIRQEHWGHLFMIIVLSVAAPVGIVKKLFLLLLTCAMWGSSFLFVEFPNAAAPCAALCVLLAWVIDRHRIGSAVFLVCNVLYFFYFYYGNDNMDCRTWAPRIILCISCASILRAYLKLDKSKNSLSSFYYELYLHCWTITSLVTGPISYVIIFGMSVYMTVLFSRSIDLAEGDKQRTSIITGVCLHMSILGRFAFYSTGHKLTFGSLHLDAGFVGTDTFHYLYAGFLLFINTFGYDVMIILGALFFCHEMQSKVFQNLPEMCIQTMSTYRCLVVCCSCICALVLRRHLMVWDIFAPKLAFEGTIFLVQAVIFLLNWGSKGNENERKKRL